MSDTGQGLGGKVGRRLLPVLLLLAMGLPGCASLPLPGPFTPGNPQAPTAQAATGWKHVAEKRDPVYLVAVDGTECTVSRARFERVERGDRILCTWR